MAESTEGAVPSVDASAWSTLVIFAVVGISIYLILLRPIFAADPNGPPADATRNQRVAPPRANGRQQPRVQRMPQGQRAAFLSSTKCPPHMAANSTRHGQGVLVEGMIPFKHCKAYSYETKNYDTDHVAANRKERAQILSRILALDKTAPPPSQGSTVLLSIPSGDVGCEKLHRIVYLLGTYFNLLVILNVEPTLSDVGLSKLTAALRGSDAKDVPVEVLPDHRIIAAQSTTGRVALVRQLGRVEFVLDYDDEIRTQLSRFGFRVMTYGSGAETRKNGTTSLLASELMP